MTIYKFIEREIVTPLSNDMFITGADLAAMLHKLEQSSELERFSKGSQVGFEAPYAGLIDVTTLEDTSQLEPDWRAAWNAGLERLKLIPAGQRSNAGNWSLDVEGVFVEEAAPPGISWNTSQLDMDEVIGEAASNNNIPYFMNPWLYHDINEDIMERRQFGGEIVVEHFLEEMHGNRFRVSFTYLMLDIARYNGLDLKEYYHFYFKLKSLPTINYPKRGVYN